MCSKEERSANELAALRRTHSQEVHTLEAQIEAVRRVKEEEKLAALRIQHVSVCPACECVSSM
jgi:hypothetical protein